MRLTLSSETLSPVLAQLSQANHTLAHHFPGDSGHRQPVHSVYGGGHLFKAEAASKLGKLALAALDQFASESDQLGEALGLTLEKKVLDVIYQRVIEKLHHEPVEDYRIDFEDGYGIRSDEEEDGHVVAAASELAKGVHNQSLPPFIGFRIKALTPEMHSRAIRTLDLFLTTFTQETNGQLPENFCVTLPKVTLPEQVMVLVQLLDQLETRLGLPSGAIKIEIMIETTQSLFDAEGRFVPPRLLNAANGRCLAAHFGAYDYTAGCNITSTYQSLQHPACDFARHLMQVGFSGTGVWVVDGATNVMPIPPHRASAGQILTPEQMMENRQTVHRAWKLHFDNIYHGLKSGFYQGWDLHPAQLPVRYAATYLFFFEGLEPAAERLRNFVNKAAQATRVRDVFDDAATGQGLLNFFLRAINCGALTEAETIERTGLSHEELRDRSFLKILQNRK